MLVSVIIPCYNVESFISECVDSVIIQTYKELEIICIDNNSNDGTWQVLQTLKTKHPQLLIEKQLKPGANAARNKGLELSTGEWIQFLDADDLLEPHKIDHQIKLIQQCTLEVAFVAGASKKRSVDGIEKIVCDLDNNIFIAPFLNKSGNTCSNLWNKKALVSIGKWNENIKSSQEVDLMLRMALSNGNMLIDKLPFTIIRERETGQISQGNSLDKWKQFIDVRLEYLRNLKILNSTIYKTFSGIFYDFMMVSVIELGKLNKDAAVQIFKNSIKENWNSTGNYGFNNFKVFIIKFLGLRFFLNVLNRL